MVAAILSTIGAVLVSAVMAACCGLIVEEVDSRRHLSGSDTLSGAVAVLVFMVSLVAGLWVLHG